MRAPVPGALSVSKNWFFDTLPDVKKAPETGKAPAKSLRPGPDLLPQLCAWRTLKDIEYSFGPPIFIWNKISRPQLLKFRRGLP